MDFLPDTPAKMSGKNKNKKKTKKIFFGYKGQFLKKDFFDEKFFFFDLFDFDAHCRTP